MKILKKVILLLIVILLQKVNLQKKTKILKMRKMAIVARP